MKKYTIRYDRDADGWWVATVKGIPGCHTQGRTIEQSRTRIREALELFVDDALSAELIDEINLPAKAKALIKSVRDTRSRMEIESTKLQQATSKAARVLTQDIGVSMRDAGAILGLSHQRIHQLVESNQK